MWSPLLLNALKSQKVSQALAFERTKKSKSVTGFSVQMPLLAFERQERFLARHLSL